MEKVTRFEELEVFQKARAICKEIYRVTDENPFKSDYRFVQQIRAAGGSIMDNIAEGFERKAIKSSRTSFLLQKVEFHSTFSRHGITEASSILLIWLNENVHVVR